MGRSREGRVYRVRQLPHHLDRGNTAHFLVRIAPSLGPTENIRVFSLARAKSTSKTATISFKDLPSIFDNDEQQWTVQAKDVCERNIIVDTHFRDFTVLNEPHTSTHTADCVAISGLASHPFGSWKHREPRSDFMWLRDELPQDVPQLRSLIYGYDTKLFESRSFQDLDDIAQSFIASLKQLRRSLTPAKALFFLAHSLGGIVLKQALVLLAQGNDDEEKKILESVKGVVFFGVPHRGMEISHFRAMVANQPNEDLITKALSPESDLLPVLHARFSRIASGINLNIRFVYETLKSQLTEQNSSGTWVRSKTSIAVLVSKESAVPLGTLPDYTIAVNEDHSNMVKFGEDDSVCQGVVSFLSDLCRNKNSQISDQNTSTYSPASQNSPLGTQDLNKGCNIDSSPFAPAQKRVRAISTIPFSRDLSFVGREDILAQLDAEFAGPKSYNWASLYGLGGIGKSQIAIEYSYGQKKRCPQISTFWVHASSRTRFEQSYVDIATKAEIPGSRDGKVEILQLVSKWLEDEGNGPWLLILDNADDDTVLLASSKSDTEAGAIPAQRSLLDFLPQVQHGAVLVTTRDRGCALSLNDRCMLVEVLSMTLDESVDLLQIWLPNSKQEEASELVKELENIPLAISQAGAYIKEVPRVSIPKYISIFRCSDKDQVALLNKNRKDLRRNPGMPNAVVTTWELSFDQIRRKHPASAELMSLMCYLNRQAIPKFLIQGDVAEIPFEESINVLISFSLVRAESGEETFEVHRLVQTAMQHWLCSEGREQQWMERAIERVAHRFPSGNQQERCWPVCEALMSHADEVILCPARSKESELHRAYILVRTAWYLLDWKGQAGLAEQRAADALQIQRQHLDKNSTEILCTLGVLASAQGDLDRYGEAIGLQEDILKQRQDILGLDHTHTLDTMHNLSTSYQASGHFAKAEDLLKRVVEARERLSGLDNLECLASQSALADVYLNLVKFEEAEKLYSWTLETSARCHGVDHTRTLLAMQGLSIAYLQQNKVGEAENLIIQAVPLFTKTFGPAHWRTLEARRYLAETYYRQGKPEKAKEICLSYLGVAREVYGPQHRTTMRCNGLLGLIYQALGEFDEASRLLEDSVKYGTEILGFDHPDTLIDRNNLARCYYDMGDTESAIQLMTEVLEKWREVLPPGHPYTTKTENCLARWKSMEEEREDWDTDGERTGEERSEEEESDEDESGEEESEEIESDAWETEEEGDQDEEAEEDDSMRDHFARIQISSPA